MNPIRGQTKSPRDQVNSCRAAYWKWPKVGAQVSWWESQVHHVTKKASAENVILGWWSTEIQLPLEVNFRNHKLHGVPTRLNILHHGHPSFLTRPQGGVWHDCPLSATSFLLWPQPPTPTTPSFCSIPHPTVHPHPRKHIPGSAVRPLTWQECPSTGPRVGTLNSLELWMRAFPSLGPEVADPPRPSKEASWRANTLFCCLLTLR